MADFHLIPVSQELVVEGTAETEAVGRFRGRVLAIGVRGTDPVAGAQTGEAAGAEGLLGWGTTHLLVADETKPAPVWVTKGEVTAHRLAEAAPSPAKP